MGIQDPVWLACSARLLIGLMPKPLSPPRLVPLQVGRADWHHAMRDCAPFFALVLALVAFTVLRDAKGVADAPGISHVPSRSCR